MGSVIPRLAGLDCIRKLADREARELSHEGAFFPGICFSFCLSSSPDSLRDAM